MKYHSQNEKRSKLYAVPYCRNPRNVDLSIDETGCNSSHWNRQRSMFKSKTPENRQRRLK